MRFEVVDIERLLKKLFAPFQLTDELGSAKRGIPPGTIVRCNDDPWKMETFAPEIDDEDLECPCKECRATALAHIERIMGLGNIGNITHDCIGTTLSDYLSQLQEEYPNIPDHLLNDPKGILERSFRELRLDLPEKKTVKGMSFYTVCPQPRLAYTSENWWRLQSLCEELFTGDIAGQYFSSTRWVVESGKHQDAPNLHFHALVSFLPQKSKNFSRDGIMKIWRNYFPDHDISYKQKRKDGTYNRGVDRVACNTLQIQDDKLKYLTNSETQKASRCSRTTTGSVDTSMSNLQESQRSNHDLRSFSHRKSSSSNG